MYSTALFLVLVTATASPARRDKTRYTKPCSCGVATKAPGIVGGAQTTARKFPWMAAIRSHKEYDCGGTLINDRYVLTAGHCVFDRTLDEIDVVIGSHSDYHYQHDAITNNVSKIIVHPNFSIGKAHSQNDIALLRLNDVILLDWKVNPICLPSISMGDRGEKGMFKHGRPAQIAGWGRLQNHGPSQPFLKGGRVKTMSREKCVVQSKYTHKEVEPGQFCALADDEETCTGDNGGPLTVEVLRSPVTMEQIGIAAGGVGCADPSYPGVYVNVSYYLDWIKENTLDAKYCRF